MNLKNLIVSAITCVVCFLSVSIGCSDKPEPAPQIVHNVEIKAAAPVISALNGSRQVQPSREALLTCDATDADSDNITYTWSATGGMLAGSGPEVLWTAPDKAGDYMISVTVSDDTGGTDSKDMIINVPARPNNAPVIEAVRFTRPKRLPVVIKPNMTDEEKKKLPELVIIKYETADLSCLASDSDDDALDYVWQATGGKLIGSGASMQWIAAGEPGKYTITIEVSDNKGGISSFSIVVKVNCCSG